MRSRPRIEILDESVTVEPGQTATAMLRVRNTGNEVAQYEVGLVEACAAHLWTRAAPDRFSLMPGDDQDVVLYFAPPLDSRTTAGEQRYAVRVTPDREEQDPAVEEADLIVGGVYALDVKVLPPHARGRRRGRYRIEFHNHGTQTVRAALGVEDDKEALGFAYTPESIEVAPGKTTQAFLEVRPRSPQLMGKPMQHPFGITWRRKAGGVGDGAAHGILVGGEVEARIQASYEQVPIIPKKAPAVATLAIVAGGFFAFRATQPAAEEAGPPPNPPDDVEVDPKPDGSFVLSWSTVGNATRDSVETRLVACENEGLFQPRSEAPPVSVEGAEKVEFTPDPPLDANIEACFQVRAIGKDGRGSIWESAPAVRVPDGSIDAPTGLTQQAIEDGSVSISWNPVDGAEAYAVYLDGETDEFKRFDVTSFALKDPGTYGVQVAAVAGSDDAERVSLKSEAINVTVERAASAVGADGGVAIERQSYGEFFVLLAGPQEPFENEQQKFPYDDSQYQAYAQFARWDPAIVPRSYIIGEQIDPLPAGIGGRDGEVIVAAFGFRTATDAVNACVSYSEFLASSNELYTQCRAIDVEAGALIPAPDGGE